MSSTAQILANRANAAFATGPRTSAGKDKVSQNALRTGLFSSRNCVAPQDAEAYEALRASLWEHFAPQNPAEELFTAEIVRASWRLQRCAYTEEALLDLACPREIAANQASVDRARTQASGVLHRAMEQLRKLQTERWARKETLPKDFDTAKLGLAATKQVISAIAADQKRKLDSSKIAAIQTANQLTQELAAVEEILAAHSPSAKQNQSAAPHSTRKPENQPIANPAAAPTESSSRSVHSNPFP
jgi:hypothetical protein